MRAYDPKIKAAVMAALLEGQSVTSVAEKYSVPRTTVATWRRRSGDPAFRSASDLAEDQARDIGVLIMDYLTTSLETLQVQARHFADKEWLARQDASDLAVLHGVQMDKAIRLLEAMARANGANTGAATD